MGTHIAATPEPTPTYRTTRADGAHHWQAPDARSAPQGARSAPPDARSAPAHVHAHSPRAHARAAHARLEEAKPKGEAAPSFVSDRVQRSSATRFSSRWCQPKNASRRPKCTGGLPNFLRGFEKNLIKKNVKITFFSRSKFLSKSAFLAKRFDFRVLQKLFCASLRNTVGIENVFLV